MKTTIIYDKNLCIGAGACEAAFKKAFRIGADGKADLLNSTEKNGVYELEVEEADVEKMEEAIAGCPVNAIQKK